MLYDRDTGCEAPTGPRMDACAKDHGQHSSAQSSAPPSITADVGDVTVSGTSEQIKELQDDYRRYYDDVLTPIHWVTSESSVPKDVRNSYRSLLAWEAICSQAEACGSELTAQVRTAEAGMRKAVEKSLNGWKCELIGYKCGSVSAQASSYAKPPKYVYRGASGTPDSLTPRGVDTEGLSTWDSPERIRGKVKAIDTDKLSALEAIPDGGGHVSIRPKNMDEMEGWIAARGTGEAAEHPLTQELLNAVVDLGDIE